MRYIRWIAYGAVAVVLAGALAVDIKRQPRRPHPSPFAVVDAVSAATGAGMSTVGMIGSDFARLQAPSPRDAHLSVQQIEDMVRQAVVMAGGLAQHLPMDAAWVVIKPNIVELKSPGSGVITDWRVVRAVIRIVHEAAPNARITIAEGGAWIPPEKEEELRDLVDSEVGDGFAIAGYRALLDDPELAGLDLDIVDLNFDEAVPVQVPDGGYVFPTYHIPLTILECDFLITCPVLKVIDAVGMTNAMKNFVGIAPGMIYGWAKMRGMPGTGVSPLPHMPGILDEVIVDLASLAEADFAVVDAIVGMERGKTDEHGLGSPVRLNTILASADIVAADAASAMLIGYNPADLEYLSLAAMKGMGQNDPAKIQINGSPLAQLRRRFEKPPARSHHYGQHGHYGQGCRRWLLSGPHARNQAPAGHEFVDVHNPGAVGGRNGWSQPVYFHDDLIDLDAYYDDPFDCVVYAYTEFQAPRDGAAELWVGSDEGLRVWIGGEQVYDFQGRRRHRLPNERVPITLSPGWNQLLVRAQQSRGGFDFSLNICEVEPDPRYDGNRVWGLTFNIPGVEAASQEQIRQLPFPSSRSGRLSSEAIMLDVPTPGKRLDALAARLQVCLKTQGDSLSFAWVQGLTGRAFRLCVGDSLSRYYAGRADLEESRDQFAHLGFVSDIIHTDTTATDFAEQQLRAWNLIQQSIRRGMPVPAHWGRSYRLIVGCDPRREAIFMEHWRGRDPQRLDMFEWGTGERNSDLALIILGHKTGTPRRADHLAALRAAVREAHRQAMPTSRRSFGFHAYSRWIDALATGKLADRRGPASVAATALEARTAAADYLTDIATDFPADAATLLRQAATYYQKETVFLQKLTKRFPYAHGGATWRRIRTTMRDPETVQLVRDALACDQQAVRAIQAVLQAMETRD